MGDPLLRRLGGCAVALALLLPAQAVTAQAAPATDQRAAATTKTREVKLGHKPVRATTTRKVRLTFTGRKGQLVNLARVDATEQCGGRVLRSRGKVVKPWTQGYWRLPRTGTYAAINKPCRNQEKARVRLQVRRVVKHDAAVPGVRSTIGSRKSVTHLVPVRVAPRQRVGVTPGAAATLVGPERRTSTVTTAGVELRAVGRHWVVLPPGGWVDTTLAIEHAAQVDGAAIAMPRAGTGSTTHEVAFDGNAGQWIYAELLDAAGNLANDTSRQVRIVKPDGKELLDAVVAGCNSMNVNSGCTMRGAWVLPSTGRYTMTVSADHPETEQPVTLRIRAAVVAPDLTLDGAPVTYTATSPGQWVIGRYQWTPTYDSSGRALPTRPNLAVTGATPTLGSWEMTAVPHLPWAYDCGWDKACDASGVTMTPSTLSRVVPASYWTGPSQPWALLAVPPGAVGSLDLTLTSP
ncbi:hypothetical protein ACNKF0_21605 [Nocardioides sp. T5]|uniref:hypothetical protein n=1 Tax=Nocardioides sp. T5 TaxID=3400182 RepID=UPI003A8A1A97